MESFGKFKKVAEIGGNLRILNSLSSPPLPAPHTLGPGGQDPGCAWNCIMVWRWSFKALAAASWGWMNGRVRFQGAMHEMLRLPAVPTTPPQKPCQ